MCLGEKACAFHQNITHGSPIGNQPLLLHPFDLDL